MSEEIVESLVLLLLLAAAASALAWLLRLPSILLLLGFGFVAGPVAGIINPDELFGPLLLPLVSLFVALILFEGGMGLRFREIRGVSGIVRNLVTLGAVITWAVGGVSAYYVLGLDARLACLLGATLCVTGPTVVLPLLEFVKPRGSVGPILKWEGIVIDPIGALLAVVVFEVVLSGELDSVATHAGAALARSVVAGGVLGLVGAGLLVAVIRLHLVPERLHAIVAMSLALGGFVLSNKVQGESGLLSVTVMGVALANQRAADIRGVVEFKENLRVLLLSSLFILLSARLKMEDLRQIGWETALFVAILIFIARPLCVAASALGSHTTWKERLFLMWLAPRGIVAAAVASVFSLALEEAGYAQARLLLPVTFGTIVITVAVYGLTIRPVAHRLGLADLNAQGVIIAGANPLGRALAGAIKEAGFRALLIDTNHSSVAECRKAGFEVYHGSILNDELMLRVDLNGIGRLLAVTPNDEVNFLATERFAHMFGRQGVFQLEPKPDLRGKRGLKIYATPLFSPEVTYPILEDWVLNGGTIKRTPITEEFDYAAYRELYGDGFIPLFVTDGSRLTVVSGAAKPGPGQSIISLIREPIETGAAGETPLDAGDQAKA